VLRIGLVGTSWWAEAMYLPALEHHPLGRITAICGRNREVAERVAAEWGIPQVFTDAEAMLGEVDAVIVASSNASHHPIALAAIERGRHVLCEKPLGLSAHEADELAAAAQRAGLVTMTPFTYRFMPIMRQLRHHLDEGYVGRPYHLAARYYTGYARDGEYSWRFDRDQAGSGVLGDLGSHWVDLALHLLGPIVEVGAVTGSSVERAPHPDGIEYDVCEDSALITVRFASGAIGHLTLSAVCWVGTPFGQTHHVEIHGSEGTLEAVSDWDTVQEVRGSRAGEPGPTRPLGRPAEIWGGLRTATVHDTYRDVFRTTEAMTRGWVTGVAEGRPVAPDLAHGALVQQIIDQAVASAADGGRMLTLTEAGVTGTAPH
jgi:predicted dehydrogenase